MTKQPFILDPLQFPLHGMRLIEASAGTGKTWTIAALYLRLVLGHGDQNSAHCRALLPPEILVVTFTEAATQELRERIRGRLTEAARCFRGQAEPDTFLRTLIEQCPTDKHLACARTLQTAADWMDEAAIYTIHGWCNRMLRQHAFDSGSLFNLELEAGDQELLQQVAQDYWRRFFYPLDRQAVSLIASLAASPDGLLHTLRGMLNEPDGLWLTDGGATIDVGRVTAPDQALQAWVKWEDQRQTLETPARQCWRQDQASIESWLREASENGWLNGNSYRRNSFEERLAALSAWAEYATPCPDMKWLVGFAFNRIKMTKSHQDKLPQHPAFVALDALADHLDCQPDVLLALKLHARCWLREHYALEKQRRARLDYDDLLINLDKALQKTGGEHLAKVIRKQYPVAMIDEFQDTDPVQYRIYKTIYQAETAVLGCGLFMIGDPKQAIYAFRGADIHTYLTARRDTKDSHYTLSCNFRSTQALVDAINQFFGHAEIHPEGAFKFNNPDEQENPLPFWPVRAQGRNETLEIDGHAQTAMTLWHWQPESDDGNANMLSYQQALAQGTAAEIVKLLNLAVTGNAGFRTGQAWRTLQPADIAVLVRHRHEAAAIRQALADCGLRSVYLSDRDSVFKTREAVDVLYWLQACAEPEQSAFLRAALATPTLDLTLAELDALQADELRWEAEVEHFKNLQKIWLNQGVLPMLRRLMADFALPQRLLAYANGERALTNLLHLSELLQTASVELDGEQALIRHLSDHIVSENAAGDDSLLRLESDSGLIKVVTLHKSKGLEYPLVFLPFICSFREVTGRQSQYYRFHDRQGDLQIDLSKSDAAKQQADQERLQEELRLLYVGLTRARHACWLGIAPVKVGNTSKCLLHKSAIGHVLSGGEPLQAAELANRLTALRGECRHIAISAPPQTAATAIASGEHTAELGPARVCGGRSLERWWVASYSSLRVTAENGEPATENPLLEAPETAQQANRADEAFIDRPVLLQPAPNRYLHQFPRGSQPGVFLHGLLEWAANTGFGKAADDAGLRESIIAPRCERRGWTHWIAELDRWLGEILSLSLPLAGSVLSLKQLPRTAYQPELEFWFAVDQVDAVRIDALVSRHTLTGLPRPRLLPQHLNGMLKGFIDLVFVHEDRYYLIDYKSNWLGSGDQAYDAQSLKTVILAERYDLQYCLYLLALHRQLRVRLGEAYDYDSHIGGALYVFLRGIHGPVSGIYAEKPPKDLIETLDRLFAGEDVNDVA